jgi:anaerobic ribonucleoside-triphosphate reductase
MEMELKSGVGVMERQENGLKDEERQACEVWTRVMGYHRPVSSFNIGKKGEVSERKFFREPCSKG